MKMTKFNQSIWIYVVSDVEANYSSAMHSRSLCAMTVSSVFKIRRKKCSDLWQVDSCLLTNGVSSCIIIKWSQDRNTFTINTKHQKSNSTRKTIHPWLQHSQNSWLILDYAAQRCKKKYTERKHKIQQQKTCGLIHTQWQHYSTKPKPNFRRKVS